MRRLAVLYDPACGFCTACRRWLQSQPQLVRLEFVAVGSPQAQARYPELAPGAPDQLTVVAEDGSYYRGDRALIVCLWALRRYRAWSFRLAAPAWRPHVRRAFEWLSKNRHDVSRLLGLPPEDAAGCGPAGCESGPA